MMELVAVRRSFLPTPRLFDNLYIFETVFCGDDKFFFTSDCAAESFSLILVERRHRGFRNNRIGASTALGDGSAAAK